MGIKNWLKNITGNCSPVDNDGLLADFQNSIGYTFRSIALLKIALTHRSFAKSKEHEALPSNERLEFLGDSVLGLISTEFLYKSFPNKPEGDLTKFKALLVNETTLSRQAAIIKLGKYILLSSEEERTGGRNRVSILADAFEGVIGAIYLDGGLDMARVFIQKFILSYADEFAADDTFKNYKGELLEYLQGRGEGMPRYDVIKEVGPDHNKIFTVDVVSNGRAFGTGTGPSKKEAEQKAAAEALKTLDTEKENSIDN